ncbi:MAG: hypothetical protein ABIQ40_08555 [Bacteroidia bacterium]
MASLKLKGYALLESMIAMIIVMMCFGFSIMIYNTIVTSSRSKLKVLARIRLENEALHSKFSNRLIDETISNDEFRIEKKLIPVENSDNLFQLHYTAITTDGVLLAEYKEFIHAP